MIAILYNHSYSPNLIMYYNLSQNWQKTIHCRNKRSFHAVVNGLLRKLLNLASQEVILELVRTKCTPILLYGLECFQLGIH